MEKKVPGEGKTFKLLPDGRMLFRSPHADNITVVLMAEEYALIRKLLQFEFLLSLAVIMPALPAAILAWEGKIAIVTAVELLLPVSLLFWLVHVYFKRRQQTILQRAPFSTEQLPGFGLRDFWLLIKTSGSIARHPLRYLIIGFLGGWWLVIGRFFGAEFASGPKTPSLFVSSVFAIVSTVGLIFYWRGRRGKDEDVSS